VLYSVPNGGNRDRIEAKLLSGEGTHPGTSDLVIMKKCKGYGGLYIEMKKPGGGVQSDFQKSFELYCKSEGYLYVIVDDFDFFKKVVNEYLRDEPVSTEWKRMFDAAREKNQLKKLKKSGKANSHLILKGFKT
jgi:hypothetical protein